MQVWQLLGFFIQGLGEIPCQGKRGQLFDSFNC
jgi:hypothetical protein